VRLKKGWEIAALCNYFNGIKKRREGFGFSVGL